ncbi:hypothetical protein [Actinomadura hibisca]|uniref:hypothetical protein n=1 Tax=Actinomadura hibisca TaxID=68565 RepID=UPI000834E913|nr:hypothetical protein [Actinomadura hibisca]
MSVVGSAVLRGGVVFGVAVLGFAFAAAGYLWWDTSGAALILVPGLIVALVALGWLYRSRRPLRFKGVPLAFGVLALFCLNLVGVVAVRDIAMTWVGVDAEAVVERAWTTQSRSSDIHHCTLRLSDGTPIPRELATNCEGSERGDTMRLVIDPRGRFAPVGGSKADLSTVGESRVTAVAALVLLGSVAIGSVPDKPRRAAGSVGRPRAARR